METAASRVRAALAPGVVQCRCGFGGHSYVFSCSREAVERVARALGRRAGVYCRRDYGVWALRIRREKDKQAVRSLLGREACEGYDPYRAGPGSGRGGGTGHSPPLG